jgi:hypothetical protein
MVLAFGKLESASACPKNVVPELSVVSHSCEKSVTVRFVVNCVLVAVTIIIVNETGHANKEVVT